MTRPAHLMWGVLGGEEWNVGDDVGEVYTCQDLTTDRVVLGTELCMGESVGAHERKCTGVGVGEGEEENVTG